MIIIPKVSKIRSISDAKFRDLIARSATYSDCLRAQGQGTNGGSSTDILKDRIRALSCDTSHFKTLNGRGVQNYVHTIDEILVENSTYANIAALKKRILQEKLLSYECSQCGLKSWRNKPISQHLDHINGIHNDHRIENLRFLCPNCHSQTDTYAGKNKISSKP